jgi:hypothetical protein
MLPLMLKAEKKAEALNRTPTFKKEKVLAD